MTEEEYQREREEAERLKRQIDSLVNKINQGIRENQILEQELAEVINQVSQLIGYAQTMDSAVNDEMGWLSNKVKEAEVNTSDVFQALNELSNSYFIFKNIGTASKNVTQFTDEYFTRFTYYSELRRITLGYVVGLDSYICSSESMRKKVEKAYLQNTEYWLAYCITATMLWANNEKEASERAISKSLSINYYNSCLYYLLINLRFARTEAAKKWYMEYLNKVDAGNLGEEWQYLLQAYLNGSFGADQEFQAQIEKSFKDMLAQVEVLNINFSSKVSKKAIDFAETYLHKTEQEFITLKKVCTEYEDMKNLLSKAEKNAVIAKYYNQIVEAMNDEAEDLPQRIENVLYSLINNYDAEELKVFKKIKYNEAIVKAKGDVSAAQANYNLMYGEDNTKNSLADLLLKWAFAETEAQNDLTVKRFAISFLKDWIIKGYEQYTDKYRVQEQVKYSVTIDNCRMECCEDDFNIAKDTLEKFYDKNKLRDVLKDKFILIYIAVCAASLLTLGIMIFAFSSIALVIGVLLGLVGSFLLWRRIVDMGKILKENKRLGVNQLKHALDELRQWRKSYKEEDARHIAVKEALDQF